MTLLQISTDHDYSKETINGVTTIEFTNLAGTATGIFSGSQINNIEISTGAAIIGSAGGNHLEFLGGDVTLKTFVFSN